MDIDTALGRVLRRERKRLKLSQEALAFEADINRNYLSLIELGRNSPSVRLLHRLCSALGMPPSEFLKEAEREVAEPRQAP